MKANITEAGINPSEFRGKAPIKPVEKTGNIDGQSRIDRLKGLLARIKAKTAKKDASVGQNTPNTEPDKPKTDGVVEQPKKNLAENEQVKTEAQEPQQNPEETPTPEPIKMETVEEICDGMAKIPRLGEDYGHDIPYRTERLMHTDGVFDEETGLYIEASYIPSESSSLRPISRLRSGSPGLTIVLSTPPLIDEETTAVSLNRMGDALRKIYGDSPRLGEEIERLRRIVGGISEYDRVKFELLYDKGKEVQNGFSEVTGKGGAELESVYVVKKPVLDSGGQFLKEIIERTAQKQIDEAEENILKTQQVIDKVKDEAISNNESAVYQYAYHATDRRNMPSISQNGLQPSGEKSKEPGTIYFNDWDLATSKFVLPEGDEGVLYRFRVPDIPEIAESWDYDDVKGLHGASVSTRLAINPDHLDFSLDRGETWMPAIPRNIKKAT